MPDQTIAMCLALHRGWTRHIKPHSPIRRLGVFLDVAENEPTTLEELSKRLGIAPGTAYEDLRALGKREIAGKEGARLLTELTGGPDSPAHRYTLSPRGKLAVETLEFQMASAAFAAAYEDDEPLEGYLAAVRHTRG